MMPRARAVGDSSRSPAIVRHSPRRNQAASGTANPCLARLTIASGTRPRIACLNRYFVVPSVSSRRGGIVAAALPSFDDVLVVAREDLVAAVAAEHHLDV